MKDHLKTTAALVALLAATIGSAAFAERGPRGDGGMLLEMFDVLDADKDGKVTQAEVEAHRAAEFAKADTNSDGVLSAEELAARQLAQMSDRASERAARMIAALDDNGDGSLSAEEMAQMVSERRFSRMDQNDDGAISKEEAQAAHERFAEGRHNKHKHKPGAAEN